MSKTIQELPPAPGERHTIAVSPIYKKRLDRIMDLDKLLSETGKYRQTYIAQTQLAIDARHAKLEAEYTKRQAATETKDGGTTETRK